MGGTIFISYRRQEDAGFAGRLFDRLRRPFGRQRLFMDVDSIPPGEDFVAVLEAQVAQCDVLLALIGRGWLTATDRAGRRRLDSPEDFVRIEVGAALAQGKRVIPVLIDDVRMPRSDELPEPLKTLSRRHAARLSHERFRADSVRLIRALRAVLAESETEDQAEGARRESGGEAATAGPAAASGSAGPSEEEETEQEAEPEPRAAEEARTGVGEEVAAKDPVAAAKDERAVDNILSNKGTTPEDAESARAGSAPDFAVFRDVDAPWCPEMVVMPAGEFLMGSPENEKERDEDEGPQHRVTIGTRFAMGRYPVTFQEYDHFCAATGREKPSDKGAGRGKRPVINVSWRDVVAYCEWLAKETEKPYRLPSEAEWEYACRAGATTRYSFGDQITKTEANFGHVGRGLLSIIGGKPITTEVGSYQPNPWGLYDMHGNVREWVEDVWHDSYEGAPDDGSAWTEGGGKDSSRLRGVRGGSWVDPPGVLRSAGRNRDGPGGRGSDLGFRVARTLS